MIIPVLCQHYPTTLFHYPIIVPYHCLYMLNIYIYIIHTHTIIYPYVDINNKYLITLYRYVDTTFLYHLQRLPQKKSASVAGEEESFEPGDLAAGIYYEQSQKAIGLLSI